MHIRFNDKDTKTLRKKLEEVSQFRPGGSWIIKSVSPWMIERSTLILNYMNLNNNSIPFDDRDTIVLLQTIITKFSVLSFKLDIKLDRLVDQYSSLLSIQHNNRVAAIDYIQGDPVYGVDSLVYN